MTLNLTPKRQGWTSSELAGVWLGAALLALDAVLLAVALVAA